MLTIRAKTEREREMTIWLYSEGERKDGRRSLSTSSFVLLLCFFAKYPFGNRPPFFCPVFFKSGFVLGEKETHTHKKVLAYSLPCFRITHYFTSKTHCSNVHLDALGSRGTLLICGERGKGGKEGSSSK